MNPITRAAVTAGAATAVAAAGFFGFGWLAMAVFAVIVLLAAGWPLLTWTPHWANGAAVILVGGALTVLGVLVGESDPFLRHAVVALGVAVAGALALEVIRPSPEGHVVTSVAGTVSGVTVAASGAAWIAAARTPGAQYLVICAAVAMVVAAFASVITASMVINVGIALAAGAGVGIGGSFVFDTIEWYGGAFIGLLGACAVMLVHELVRREVENTNTLAGIAAGVAPVMVAGSLVYIGGRILIG